MEKYEISTVCEYIECIKCIKLQWFKKQKVVTIWYRGVNNRDHKLLPGAYWRKKCDEESLTNTFYTMLPSYSDKIPSNDWDWYFSMQHYGFPTRLLDWTENPLYALYFAVVNYKKPKIPCVWVIEPVCINKCSFGPKENYLYIPNGGSICNYLPDNCGRGKEILKNDDPEKFSSNEYPIAIFPNRSNPRMVAQRGVFTLHGIREIPIDEHLDNNKFGIKPHIVQISIDNITDIRNDLFNMGIDVFQLFPEPDKIAQYAKELYGIK